MACPHNWKHQYKGPNNVITICTLCDAVITNEEYAAMLAKSVGEVKVVGMDIDEAKEETWRDRPPML